MARMVFVVFKPEEPVYGRQHKCGIFTARPRVAGAGIRADRSVRSRTSRRSAATGDRHSNRDCLGVPAGRAVNHGARNDIGRPRTFFATTPRPLEPSSESESAWEVAEQSVGKASPRRIIRSRTTRRWCRLDLIAFGYGRATKDTGLSHKVTKKHKEKTNLCVSVSFVANLLLLVVLHP